MAIFTSANSSGTALEENGNANPIVEKDDEAKVHTAKEDADSAGQYVAPDGGLRAWLVVLGVWCTSFCTFGWINSIGVFQDYYQETILSEYSTSAVSWIPSLQVFFMMAMGPIIGLMSDRFNPRYIIFGGTVLHVFGLMMTSISDRYYSILLSQGVCSAIGVSAIFQPALNCIPGWFTTKRGAAFGILATGSSLGGVIFPIMVGRMIPEVGFGWTMRISAFLILTVLIVANITVKANHPLRPQTVTLKQFLLPLTEFEFICLSMGLLLFTFGLYVPVNYVQVEAVAAGMDADLAQYIVPILNAASLFGRVGSGFAGDKFGRFNVFITVCYIAGILVLALWIPAATTAARIAFAALFGFFSGAYVALIVALVVQISPLSEIGFRTGIIFFASSFGGLLTSPICGVILARTNDWVDPKIFSGVCCLVGTSFILAARIHKTGWKLMAKF